MLMSHHAFLVIFYCSGQTIKTEARLVDTEMPSSSGGTSYCIFIPSLCPTVHKDECLNSNIPTMFLGRVAARVPGQSLTFTWH